MTTVLGHTDDELISAVIALRSQQRSMPDNDEQFQYIKEATTHVTVDVNPNERYRSDVLLFLSTLDVAYFVTSRGFRMYVPVERAPSFIGSLDAHFSRPDLYGASVCDPLHKPLNELITFGRSDGTLRRALGATSIEEIERANDMIADAIDAGSEESSSMMDDVESEECCTRPRHPRVEALATLRRAKSCE